VPNALADELKAALAVPGEGLARAALVIARLEYPRLDPSPCLDRLEALGARAAERMRDTDPTARVAGLMPSSSGRRLLPATTNATTTPATAA